MVRPPATSNWDNWQVGDIWERDGTRKDRGYAIDLVPFWVLAGRLAKYDEWWHHSRRVREDSSCAHRIAADYIWRGPHARRAIETLLHRAAAEDTPGMASYAVANTGTRAYWSDADLEPGDPVYNLSEGAKLTLTLGADIVARRGAKRCIECSAKLRAGRRRNYCQACGALAGRAAEARERRNIEAVRSILYRAVPVILPDVPARIRDRRIARRK